jgi:hypothetical protein
MSCRHLVRRNSRNSVRCGLSFRHHVALSSEGNFDGKESLRSRVLEVTLEGTKVPYLSPMQPTFLVEVKINSNERSYWGDSVRFTRHAASGMLTRLR